ncbi:hypothetical protein F5887DRAFT_1172300, partial [Amanita rubescens]
HSPIFPVTKAAVQAVANAAHYTGIGISQDLQRCAALARRHNSTDIRATRQRIMDDIRELYCCRPDFGIFQRSWRPDTEFEVNFISSARLELTLSTGQRCIVDDWPQPRIISYSKTVMSSTDVPNRLVFYQSQEYVTRWFGWKKVINSVIVVSLDKIERLVDQLNGAELPTQFGAQYLRIMNAKVLPWFPKTAT